MSSGLKEREVRITAEGRDKGKKFLITEMPASAAEEWGWQFFLALANNSVDVDQNIVSMGMVGAALVGLNALMKIEYQDAKPLLATMMDCVQALPDAGPRALVENDIMEVATRLQLRQEVLELHAGFTLAGLWSMLISGLKSSQDSGNIQTSPEPSA